MPPRKLKLRQASHPQSRAEYKENVLSQDSRPVTFKQDRPPEILKPRQLIVPGNRNHIRFESPSKKTPKMLAGNNHINFNSSIKEPQKRQNENTDPANPTNDITSSPQKSPQSQKMVGAVKKTGFVGIQHGVLAPVVEKDKNRLEREESPSKIARAEKKRKNRQAKREKQKLQREAKKKASHRSKDDIDTDDVEDVEMADVVESEKDEHPQTSTIPFTSSPQSGERFRNVKQKADSEDYAEVEVEKDDKLSFGRFSASNLAEFSEYVNTIDAIAEDMDVKNLEKADNAADSRMAYYRERFRRYFVGFSNWSALISGGAADIHQMLDMFRITDLGSQQGLAEREMMVFREKYWAICCFNIETVINKGWCEDVIAKGEGMLEDLKGMHYKLLKDENIYIIDLSDPFYDFGHHDDHYEEKVKLKLGLSSG